MARRKPAPAAPASDPGTQRRGRPPLLQEAMLDELRGLIVSGEIAPGERIEDRRGLTRRFDSSGTTVQRVVDRLVAEGLVETRGPKGTFVVERPPHLHRVALVFPFGPDQHGGWLRFYAAIARSAGRLRAVDGGGADLVTCFAHHYQGWTPEFSQLQEDCRRGLLRGLVFVSPPEVWAGTPVCDAPLPRVTLSTTTMPGVASLPIDPDGFMRLALDTVRRRGCTRPAVIGSTEGFEVDGMRERWVATFAAAGVELRPQWVVAADLSRPVNAVGLTRLLCASWNARRPDAIIIADDNFERPVLEGMQAEGLAAGRDALVIAHANFPRDERDAQATLVQRIGFDTGAMLRRALAWIPLLAAGTPPAPTTQPAQHAGQVEPAPAI